MLRQRTLKQSVETVGVGLHSGCRVALVLNPAPANTGIVFRRVDITPHIELPAKAELVGDTRMASVLEQNGTKVSTVEHLMSALSGLGIDNAIIDVDAPEIPIMDGSAASFVYLLQTAGLEEQNALKKFIKITKPIEVIDGDKWARLVPYFGCSYEFTIDFNHPAIDKTIQTVKVDFADTSYTKEIARARTFGFMHEVEALRSMGLARGGSLENAIVVDNFRVLNGDGLRADDEFVKHKILDAMGDIYLIGHPILGAYQAYKSGHGLNNQLLRALLAQPDAYEIVTFSKSTEAPSAFAFEPSFA